MSDEEKTDPGLYVFEFKPGPDDPDSYTIKLDNEKVVDIRSRQPHTTGPAKCAECDFEWIAVVEVGERFFECPACKCIKGHRAGAVMSVDTEIFVCNCKSSVFSVELLDDQPYLLCVCCGVRTGIAILD